MDITFYAITIGVVAFLALMGTLVVAKNPEDKNYGNSMNKRFKNLGIIYIVFTIGTVAALINFIFKHMK